MLRSSGIRIRKTPGRELPPTPVDAQHGFPWFELYDADRGDIAGSARLEGLNEPIEVPSKSVKRIRRQPK